jgi:KipI family sensor histidine kinase inhibitor
VVAKAVRIDPLGDAALLVTLGETLDPDVNARARALAAALGAAGMAGLGVPVAGHASVLVPFDPAAVGEAAVRGLIAATWPAASRADAAGEPAGALHELPVRYGGADGPDLAAVAAATGATEDEVVRLHSGVEYRVLVLGFVPGFAYLGILPPELELPRLAVPRVRVPAGSVAISGRQSGVYPFDGPGGWHLLGRTDLPLWNPEADPPARLAPGDRVRFVPV